VIGEFSRNAKSSLYFKCQGYNHVTAQCPSRNLLINEAMMMRSKQSFMNQLAATDFDDDVRISNIQLGIVRYSHIAVSNEDWRRSSMFHTYITHEGKNYKLMINGNSYANIIVKTTLEKMGLKVEPNPHPYNVNWVDQTAESITLRCQVFIHMSSYEDRIWCDVLNIYAAHILLGRP